MAETFEDKVRAELRASYLRELGDIPFSSEREADLEEYVELNLFLMKEANGLQYSRHFENEIG